MLCQPDPGFFWMKCNQSLYDGNNIVPTRLVSKHKHETLARDSVRLG